MLQQQLKTCLKKNEKIGHVGKEIESLSKEKEDIKKNQMEILELKITRTGLE